MRQSIVLGYDTRHKSEAGKVLLQTSSKDEAIAEVNDPKGGYMRKEMHVLAMPFKRRFFDVPATPVVAKKTKKG